MVGPTAVLTGCAASAQELAAEAAKLNADPAVVRAVASEVAAALSSPSSSSSSSSLEGDGDGEGEVVFRPWEQVKGVCLLVEPFTVANGLMTQTLKVRKNVVLERYAKEVDGIYK
jgi:long-subunit acyl-CoA synthetase (AMP-forming)